MTRRRRSDDDEGDDRPPICPACGVTMGIVFTGEGTKFVCLECGFSDDAREGRPEEV
jgi:rubredoxin